MPSPTSSTFASILPTRRLSRRTTVLLLLAFAFCIFLLLPSTTPAPSRSVVISIASSAARLDRELPIALRTLLAQTIRPSEIRVHLPLQDEPEIEVRLRSGGYLAALFSHSLVQRFYVDDVGPATKYVYILGEMLKRVAAGEPRAAARPIVIADDDHAYSPHLLSTLLDAHAAMPNASIGLRGWRVRDDLIWGVPYGKVAHHVVQGHLLSQSYRASVLTANEAYLVTADMFRSPSLHPYLFNRTALAASPAHLVDDIVMAGSLCAARVPRYVVPLRPAHAVPSVDVTRHHTLERHMAADGTDRAGANNAALELFGDAWRAEALWYDFDGAWPPRVGHLVSWYRAVRAKWVEWSWAASLLATTSRSGS